MASEKHLQLKHGQGNSEVNVYPFTKSTLVTMTNGETVEDMMNNHQHRSATVERDGMMTKEDKMLLRSLDNVIRDLTNDYTVTQQDIDDVLNYIK